MSIAVQRLGPLDTALMRSLNRLFASAFEDDQYPADGPSDSYFERVLGWPGVIALVALDEWR